MVGQPQHGMQQQVPQTPALRPPPPPVLPPQQTDFSAPVLEEALADAHAGLRLLVGLNSDAHNVGARVSALLDLFVSVGV